MGQKSLRYSTLTIKDGSGTPKTMVAKIGEGTITWTQKRPVKYVKNRGILDTVRAADDEPLEVNFNGVYEWLKGDSGDAVNLYEVLTCTGRASTLGWTSSDTDTCAPYAVHLLIDYDPICSGATSEHILFSNFRYETVTVDEKEGTFDVKGMCNITAPTVTRS